MYDRHFSDEELVAYLDGEADFAPMDDIRRALETDTALQKRLAALDINTAALADAFGGLEPGHVAIPVAPAPRRRGLVASLAAGALAAGLAIGYVAGSWNTTPDRGWVDYVAAYQALYSHSTLAHVDTTPVAQQAELDRVGAAIGKSIPVGKLTVFPDAEYARAQILSFRGKALIQLAFLTSTGDPLALCIIRTDPEKMTDPEFKELEGLSAASWARSGYAYLLIGGNDAAMIERMSQSFIGMDV